MTRSQNHPIHRKRILFLYGKTIIICTISIQNTKRKHCAGMSIQINNNLNLVNLTTLNLHFKQTLIKFIHFQAAYHTTPGLGPDGEVWCTYSRVSQWTFGIILAAGLNRSYAFTTRDARCFGSKVGYGLYVIYKIYCI